MIVRKVISASWKRCTARAWSSGTCCTELRELVRPGVTTKDLDDVCRADTRGARRAPAFKGYMGYPCVVVHLDQSGSGARNSVGRARVEGRRHPLDGFRSRARRLLRRRGSDGSGGKDRSGAREAAARDARIAGSRHRESAARQSLERHFRRRAGVGRAATVFRWCANSWVTASAPRCTKSRSFRITASRATARACRRAWCWPSSRWSIPAAPSVKRARR